MHFDWKGRFLSYTEQVATSVWAVPGGTLAWKRPCRPDSVPTCSFVCREESELLYLVDEDGVTVVEVGGAWKATLVQLPHFYYSPYNCHSEVSRDGKWLAVSGQSPIGLAIWDLDEHRFLRREGGGGGRIAFHPTLDLLARPTVGGVDVVSVADGRPQAQIRFPRHSALVSLTFNPTGDLLAIHVMGAQEIWRNGEPDWDAWNWVEVWDWKLGVQVFRIADAKSPSFASGGNELVVIGRGLEFWSIPGGKGASGPAPWTPDHDSQGNPYGHPNYMEDN